MSKMESGSWRDCCQSGVNLATPVYEDKPGSKLELNYNCRDAESRQVKLSLQLVHLPSVWTLMKPLTYCNSLEFNL